MIQVVPLTITLRGFHTEVVIEPDPANGLELSAAQCQHVRALSPARVVGTIGNVGPLALSQIRETIAASETPSFSAGGPTSAQPERSEPRAVRYPPAEAVAVLYTAVHCAGFRASLFELDG